MFVLANLLNLCLASGHWKLGHTVKNMVILQINILTQFVLFTLIRTLPGLFESFGFGPTEKPAFISFALFSIISAPLNEVSGCRWMWRQLVNDQSHLVQLQL